MLADLEVVSSQKAAYVRDKYYCQTFKPRRVLSCENWSQQLPTPIGSLIHKAKVVERTVL